MSATIFKRGIAGRALSLIFLPLCSAPLFAQVGNDNRTGVAGVFNGNVTTGCSYDPYTANAMRSVTDLVVAGGVGTYPLAFSRVANSRSPQYASFQFGGAGGWQHSYSWSMADSDEGASSQFQPGYYLVNFPDGRTIGFVAGSPFDGYFYGGPGIRERFQPMGSNRLAYLILSDGGKIQFHGTLHSYRDADTGQWFYYYTYQAQAIIDPYGLPTTLAYNSDGSLNTIHEPAGRWLQLIYRSSDHAIDHVQASDGRVVQYN
jgi:hypothetical protein